MIHPLSSKRAPFGGRLHLLQYSCIFSQEKCTRLLSCYTFCGLATYTASSFPLLFPSTSMFGHSHFQCSTLQHLKHFTFSSSLSYCLTFTLPLTPHCITQLTNTSNLCYESPKRGIVSQVFKHLIQNLKMYNGVEI